MNINLEKIDNMTAKIVVSVDENDYAAKVTEELNKIGRTHTIPGFRKGHVPASQLMRRFGRDVKSDVINREVIDRVFDYIKEQNLQVLGEPLPVERKEISLDVKDYTFEYEIGLAPEIGLNLNKEVNMPYYQIEVSQQMVDGQDEGFRKRFGSREAAEEVDATAIVKGVIMELNEDGSIKESEDAIQVTNGMIGVFQIQSEEQRALFVGKKINDKVTFNASELCGGNVAEIASMLNIEKDQAAEVKSNFEMAISEILVVKLAERNQEYFDEVFGRDKVHNEEEYFAKLKEIISADLAQYSDQRFRNDSEKQLLEMAGKFELPETFLKKWLLARNPEAKAEEIDSEFGSILDSLRWQLVKERVAKQLEIKIEEEDIKSYARSLAAHQLAQYGMMNMDEETVDGMAGRLLSNNEYRSRIIEAVGDVKLFSAIKNAVTLDTKEVSLDEFQKMMMPSMPDAKAE